MAATSLYQQLELVRKNGLAIKDIDNPCPAVQRAAVLHDPQAIGCVSNPTLEAQRLAVTRDNSAISLIRNPGYMILKAANVPTEDHECYRHVLLPHLTDEIP